MTTTLKLNNVWNVEPIDWLHELSSHKIIGATTQRILRECIDHGGYITGGFARNLSRCIMFERNILPQPETKFGVKIWEWLERYCNRVTIAKAAHRRLGPYDRQWKNGIGDIDIFFPTEEIAVRTCKWVTDSAGCGLSCEWSSSTMAGYGMEYIAGDNLLQLITKLTGGPDDVLRSFDLTNAQIYLDCAGLHWNNAWCQLEERKLLGIDRWDKPNLLWRVNKWFSRNNYVDFREGDHEKFVDSALNTIKLAACGELKRFGREVETWGVRGYAKKYWPVLTARELLKISCGYDTYDQHQIFKELFNRGVELREI